MKVCQGDRIMVTTGPMAGEFGEIGYYDADEGMFVAAIDDREVPYLIRGSQFRVINIDMEQLGLFEEASEEDE